MDKNKIIGTIDIEPRWVDLCSLSTRGGLSPKFLLPACETADVVRQAQKQGKKGVTFLFLDDGTCEFEVIEK